jgi:hypothetical protein
MEVVPHERIGLVHIGMPHEEATRLCDPGMQLGFEGNPLVVAFIQVAHGTGAEYRGVDLFNDPADDVVASIVQLEGLNPADFPPSRHEYLFPDLNMILWRGEVSDEPDAQGYTFQAASIHVPGYYER